MTFSRFDLNQPYWTDHPEEEVDKNAQTSSVNRSQVNALAAVCASVFSLIGPFAVQSHLFRKPLLPIIAVPFAQAAGYQRTQQPCPSAYL